MLRERPIAHSDKSESRRGKIYRAYRDRMAALLEGCATTQTTMQNRESMLVACGFKVITPEDGSTATKASKPLPPGKVTMIQKGKKTYYIFPDPVHNPALMLADQKSTRLTNSSALKISLPKEDLETAERYQDSEMQWSSWGGSRGAGWGANVFETESV